MLDKHPLMRYTCSRGLGWRYIAFIFVSSKKEKDYTMISNINVFHTDDTPIIADIHQAKSSLTIEQVSRGEQEPLWDHLVKKHHYLGHQKIIGPRVKYLIWLDNRPVSAISFNQAAYKMADWKDAERQEHLGHVLSNNRYPNKNKIQTF